MMKVEKNIAFAFLFAAIVSSIFLAGLVNAADTLAIAAYRSNTGACAVNLLNCPKIRLWNSSTQAWGAEQELATAGSPIREALIKASPVSKKMILVTLSDDGYLDAYACNSSCWNPASWTVTNNIGRTWTTAPATHFRGFNFAFESATGDAVLVYADKSSNASRDLAYKILPANATDFSGIQEQYIDDAGHATNVDYTWISMAGNPKPTSEELILAGFDGNNTDINAWVWNGTAWTNQTQVSGTATATNGYEALGVIYSSDGSNGTALGGDGTSGNVNTKFWNGSSWSTTITFDIDPSNNDAYWLTVKADPLSDDLQVVIVDSGSDLHTAYWSGTTWSVTSDLDTSVDIKTARPADFAWNPVPPSGGQIVWDTDATGTTLSNRSCTPQCTSATTTVSGSYAGRGRWITSYTVPGDSTDVRILSLRLNSNFDIGSFNWTGLNHYNYGDSALTADTTVSTYESYSLAFETPTRPYEVTILTPTNDTWTTQRYLNITGICKSLSTPLINATLNYNTFTVGNTTISNATPFYFNVSTASDGYYYYNITCYSTNSLSNTSETRLLTVDATPPSYGPDYDSAGGVTYEGTIVNIYVYWTDAGSGLDTAVFRSNQTGVWTNVSACVFAGAASGWCNTTINTVGSVGQTICWNQYANDTLASLNASMPENTHCFYVTANKPPQIALNQPANDTQYNDTVNGTINGDFNFTATDDQNTTFSCSIFLNSVLNQTNSSTLNNTLTDFLINGIIAGNHTWFINCSDGQLTNVSETRSFSVAGVAPTPSPTPSGGGGGPQCTDNSQCPSGQYCNGGVCVACSCSFDGVCHVCCTIIGQSDPDCQAPTPNPTIFPTLMSTLSPSSTANTSVTPTITLFPTPFVTPSIKQTLAPTPTPKVKLKDVEDLLDKVSSLFSEAQSLGLNTDAERSAYDRARQQLAAGNFDSAWDYGVAARDSLDQRIARAKTVTLVRNTSLAIVIILLLLSLFFAWKRRREFAWHHKLEKKMLGR